MPTETTPALTLFEAVQRFLGPLEAEYCRIIDEGSPDRPKTSEAADG